MYFLRKTKNQQLNRSNRFKPVRYCVLRKIRFWKKKLIYCFKKAKMNWNWKPGTNLKGFSPKWAKRIKNANGLDRAQGPTYISSFNELWAHFPVLRERGPRFKRGEEKRDDICNVSLSFGVVGVALAFWKLVGIKFGVWAYWESTKVWFQFSLCNM